MTLFCPILSTVDNPAVTVLDVFEAVPARPLLLPSEACELVDAANRAIQAGFIDEILAEYVTQRHVPDMLSQLRKAEAKLGEALGTTFNLYRRARGDYGREGQSDGWSLVFRNALRERLTALGLR